MPQSMSLEAGTEATRKMREILLRHPEIITVVSQHGRPDNGSDASPFSNVELFAPLKPYDEWPAGMTKDKLTAQLQAGIRRGASRASCSTSRNTSRTTSRRRCRASRGRTRSRSSGPTCDVLEHYAGRILQEMQHVKGMEDVGIFHIVGQPNLNIKIDRAEGGALRAQHRAM